MSYIIVGRSPVTLRLFVVEREDAERRDVPDIKEFSTREEAEDAVKRLPAFKSRWYDVVEVDKD